MVRCFYLWKDSLERYEAGNLAAKTRFNREELDALSRTLEDRIDALMQEDSLSKTPLLDFVLHFWDEHADGAGSLFASRLSSTEEGFADLAVGALSPQPPMAARSVHRLDAPQLEKWTATPGEELVKRCEALLSQRPEWLQEIHTIALEAFIDEVRSPRDKWGRPAQPNSTPP